MKPLAQGGRDLLEMRSMLDFLIFTHLPLISAVDNPVEKLWRSCGQPVDNSGFHRGCGKLWITWGVIHRQGRVIHRFIHRHFAVWVRPKVGYPHYPQALL
jgi:hypothetical protein